MENQEKENKEPIIEIVDQNPILDDKDYRVTGDDFFTVCVEGSISCGPGLRHGEKVVMDYLKLVERTNREKGFEYVRIYNPLGFIWPPEWADEIYN